MTAPNPPGRRRVLQCITHLGLGGAERVAFSLMRHLRDSFDFAVFAATGEEKGEIARAMRAELAELNIPYYTGTSVPIKRGGLLLAGLAASRARRHFRPDIIHLHTEIPEASHAVMVTLFPAGGRIPLVRTVHNSVYWHDWPGIGRWCERRMRRARVAAVSEDALAAFARWRAASGTEPTSSPPTVIYNGVAIAGAPHRPKSAPGARLRLLFAGRFEPQKGTDLLPCILECVPADPQRPLELVLYGRGSHEALLRRMAARPPPGWSVQVFGPVADLGPPLKECDLVIVPSRFEGLGLVAIEATLLGLPVVATDTTGLREALPSDYPWRARPGDARSFAQALLAAIDAAPTWPAVVVNAQRFALQRFSPHTMTDRYRQLYASAFA
jgi:glycosyltransferase involved in cell wall biosynthesis